MFKKWINIYSSAQKSGANVVIIFYLCKFRDDYLIVCELNMSIKYINHRCAGCMGVGFWTSSVRAGVLPFS